MLKPSACYHAKSKFKLVSWLHHSGINYLTHADVHNGKEQEIIDTRNKLKEMAKKKHPERFARYKKIEVQTSVSLTRVNTLLTKEQNYALYKNYKNN